jgi:hypothetical protein
LQQWAEHFVWILGGLRVLGTTPVGRATCNRLDLNDDFHHQGFIQEARSLWIQGDWHPPVDDPKQEASNRDTFF